MPNTSAVPMTNDSAAIATLNIRVTSIEGRVSELSSAVTGVQSALSGKIDSLATSLSSKIDDRGRPQWAIYIAGMMAVASLYAYIDNSKIGPLKEKDADLIALVRENSRIIREDMVPNWVNQKEWGYRDLKFKEIDDRIKFSEGAIIDRVKRLEELYGSSYNLRDAIQQMDNRIQHFERQAADKKP
jgi:hypothetical protein